MPTASDGVHVAITALLGQYLPASVVSVSDSQGSPIRLRLRTRCFLCLMDNSIGTTGRRPSIADGLRLAPHAVYALVQMALVQDEALKRANARIEELQAQTAGELQQQSGFLGSVRDEILGRRDPRGSVPSVRSRPGVNSRSPQAAAAPSKGPAASISRFTRCTVPVPTLRSRAIASMPFLARS